MRFLLLAFLLWFLPLLAIAADVVLPATLEQAGLAVAIAPPNSRITQDGRRVMQQPDGRFLLAAGQLQTGVSVVEITPEGGKWARYRLKITPRTWPIQRINGLPDAMVTPPKTVLARINADNAAIGGTRRAASPVPYWTAGFSLPAKGRFSGAFGGRRILNGIEKQPHRGFDIAAPTGTAVLAPAAGIVRLAHPDMYYTGKTVVLDHGDGLTSILIHMSAIDVQRGETVQRGQRIGAIGQTGRATGPHLHWGVFLGNIALDPQRVLQVLAEN